MSVDKCHLMTQEGHFFDITHTFTVGSSTYHILGLRKDRPTYRHNYYVFNCAGDQHESASASLPRSSLYKRFARASEQGTRSRDRLRTAHHSSTTELDNSTPSRIQKTKSTSSHPRVRAESAQIEKIDTKVIEETFTKALRADRQLLTASLRKEMNIKKRTLLRSIKKEKQVILQATADGNKDEEIIRLLNEQKTTLATAYERYVDITTSSLHSLKQTLVQILDAQTTSTQSMAQLQQTLIQAVEQGVEKIVSNNEEIRKATSAETIAISQLQKTLVQKIDNYVVSKKHDSDAELNRLFTEQKRALTDVVSQQQQQTFSLDLVKQAMIDALTEQQQTSVNVANSMQHLQSSNNDSITNISSEHTQMNNNNHSLFGIKPSQSVRFVNQSLSKSLSRRVTDHHLFKVSIRSSESAHLYAKLNVDGIEYSRRLYTFCQRDVIQNDVYNCYIAPPAKDGLYEVTIYAKTNRESTYRAALCLRLPAWNISQTITFPLAHQAFDAHQCILIEPLQRLLRQNEQVLIHMVVPGADAVKICNGDENIELDVNEYKNEVVKKKIRVRGDVCVIGCWDKKTDLTICAYNMI